MSKATSRKRSNSSTFPAICLESHTSPDSLSNQCDQFMQVCREVPFVPYHNATRKRHSLAWSAWARCFWPPSSAAWAWPWPSPWQSAVHPYAHYACRCEHCFVGGFIVRPKEQPSAGEAHHPPRWWPFWPLPHSTWTPCDSSWMQSSNDEQLWWNHSLKLTASPGAFHCMALEFLCPCWRSKASDAAWRETPTCTHCESWLIYTFHELQQASLATWCNQNSVTGGGGGGGGGGSGLLWLASHAWRQHNTPELKALRPIQMQATHQLKLATWCKPTSLLLRLLLRCIQKHTLPVHMQASHKLKLATWCTPKSLVCRILLRCIQKPLLHVHVVHEK